MSVAISVWGPSGYLLSDLMVVDLVVDCRLQRASPKRSPINSAADVECERLIIHAKLQQLGGITRTKPRSGDWSQVSKRQSHIDKVDIVQDKFCLAYCLNNCYPHLTSHLRHGFHPKDQQFGTAPEASLLCVLCYHPQNRSILNFRINSPCCESVRTHLPQRANSCG